MEPRQLAKQKPIRAWHMIKTYRYLRVGMIGAVVLLAASVLIERIQADCWQTSVSAYYYTPVRAIFVGSLIAVGAMLIIYQGRGWFEDLALTISGMLAPVVAVVPTSDGARSCTSPFPPPTQVAETVRANISNNFKALLIVGGFGLILSIALAIGAQLKERGQAVRPEVAAASDRSWSSLIRRAKSEGVGRWVEIGATTVLLLGGLLAFLYWDGFDEFAHGWAAFGLIGALVFAILSYVLGHWGPLGAGWKGSYLATAGLMIIGFLVIWFGIGGAYKVLWVELWEIFMFMTYWILQTWENWKYEYGLGWEKLEGVMIREGDILCPYTLREEENLEELRLSRIWDNLETLKVEEKHRVVVLTLDRKVQAVCHRSLVTSIYLRVMSNAAPAVAPTSPQDVLENIRIRDLQPTERAELYGIGFVAEGANLDAVAAQMKYPCSDVFVTPKGRREEPVIGWLTDIEVAGIERAG